MANSKTSQNSRKTVPAKNAATRKSRPSSAAESRSRRRTDSRTAKEVRCIIFVFVCFMLAMSYYTPFFGLVGSVIKNIGMFLFGNTAYIIPVFACIAGVHMLIKETLRPHVHRYVAAVLMCVCISGLLAVHSYRLNPTLFGSGYSKAALDAALEADPDLMIYKYSSFWGMLSNIILAAKTGAGGGIFGYFAAILFIRLVSPVGTTVLLWAMILTFGVIATGTAPFIRLSELFRSWLERRRLAAEEARAEDDSEPDLSFADPEPVEYEKNEKEEKKTAEHKKKKQPDQGLRGLFEKVKGKGGKAVKEPSKKEKKQPEIQHKTQTKPRTKKIKPESVTPQPAGDDIKIKLFDVQPEDIPEEIQEMAKAESGAVEAQPKAEKPKAEPAIPVNDDEIDTDYIPYRFPSVNLLVRDKPTKDNTSEEDVRQLGQKLIDALRSFGVDAKIIAIIKGPAITRFEISPATGVKVNKIVNLANDIALNLAAVSVRVIAPIPGKAAVGIEIPNEKVATVRLRDVIDTPEFRNYKSKTAFALGKDVSGKPKIADVSKMPHLLIAGATGSGKSVCINTLITSIIYKADPNEVKMIMIDPKVVELGVYNGIPHLLIPVVTDPRRAAGALNWAVQEMIKRYKQFAENNVRNITGFNELAEVNGERKMEHIIIIVDELADLMMVSAKEVEDSICRLAQMARAAGMYLVIATQRPSVDVITGLIKANIPSRIALKTSNQFDSRTILDMGGAEKLLGRGDMLFLPMGASSPVRIQGAFVSDEETEAIVEFVKQDFDAKYDEDIIEHIERGADDGGDRHDAEGDADEMLPAAIQAVVEAGQARASLLQRRLKVGYARAGRLIDQLEERGIIGPHEGSKPRAVLMSRSEYLEMQAMGDE